MKKTIIQFSGIFIFLLLFSCTKTEDEVSVNQEVTGISLSSSQTNLAVGNSVTFNVTSNFGSDLTDESVILVNDEPISGNTYTFTQVGNYSIKASYSTFQSSVISITVSEESIATNQFVSRVLVEEYSGTWCGNCPRILYGTELLKEQTNKAVSVQIHLFGGDPFISPSGNSLASAQGVNGVPTGKINRTLNWSGPQYQNVAQVIDQIQPSAQVGLAINATLVSNALSVSVKMGFAETLNTKLVVYLVEDNLFHTQANYSSNLYGGLSSIPNFKYDGVLRSVVSSISGDAIVAGTEVQKMYSLNLPSNINNTNNIKIVAFLTDSNNGTVLNVREVKIGQSQELEFID